VESKELTSQELMALPSWIRTILHKRRMQDRSLGTPTWSEVENIRRERAQNPVAV